MVVLAGGVRGREVLQAPMISPMIAMTDELADGCFEVFLQEAVFQEQQDSRFE